VDQVSCRSRRSCCRDYVPVVLAGQAATRGGFCSAPSAPYPDAVEKLLFDQVVETDYGQFDLVWSRDGGFDGDFDRVFAGQNNGLVGAADPDGVYINLARRSGGSPVRIVLMDEPAMDDPSWEDVVEVSFALPEGHEMQWSTWAGANRGTLEGLPPGSYRLRVSATGRDQGHAGEFADHPVDAYLLQIRPAPPQPDSILRIGSEEARYWHREVGNRR